MTVKLESRKAGATISDISEIVPGAVGSDHADWIYFLQANDGAVPEDNEFAVPSGNKSGVTRFFGVAEVRKYQKTLSDRMPSDALAIATAEGGNFVCLGLAPGRAGVLFWDHEIEELEEAAPSFAEFLELLKPFSVGSVKLEPGQVKSVWVSPALLEAQERARAEKAKAEQAKKSKE